ncbi:IclR family transcriptional regulator [Actinoplanes ianthinogenes]|uniref:IclR family transcriptional regulator n=1 Tax=Actinoplanes ianthinogenes TaxID=122358 RepID=A0ABN6C939_9ACTN|nr:IclR family transcriptional regulator [Actinoplanes ianthinogenes]BCJ41941.1 IclR family transcriptional regulator [Actinoplanes ianthinogenes]GGR55759.1 IclR family transcriptional regulator [Actinoplanes ianthinogenes]
MPGMIQSIERSSAVLRLLAAGPDRLRVKEIADALGLPKSTAHGILRTLEHVGFAEQDPRTARYRLGRALLDLGNGGLDVNELRSRALDWADTLATRSVEAVRIGVLEGAGVRVVHHVFRPDGTTQAMDTGLLIPAHATSLGKALLAYDATATDAVLRAGLVAYTRRTVTHRRELAAALAETRRQGWAGAVDEWQPGRAGIAAPVRTFGGLVVGAIGVYGPAERICDGRLRPRVALVEQVCAAANAISRDLTEPRS